MGCEYCETHDVDFTGKPYSRCPYCEMEQEREMEMVEQALKDRRVEPY